MQNFLSKVGPAQWAGLILTALAIVFVIMNRDEIPINFFGIQITGPAWVMLLLVFVAGWVVGVLTTRKRLKRPIETK